MSAREVRYRVVINHEEQYSIWPVGLDFEKGWRDTGTSGSRRVCQSHVDEVWTDMRPLSVRRAARRRSDDAYKVVINHEEQYSIWFADQRATGGWRDEGHEGPLRKVQAYVEEVWTDMRPLSVRG